MRPPIQKTLTRPKIVVPAPSRLMESAVADSIAGMAHLSSGFGRNDGLTRLMKNEDIVSVCVSGTFGWFS